MKAFWWFKEGAIAGMARPGFNHTPWFDFPFEEALIVGWIGQHPSGTLSREAFHEHLQTYGRKIRPFYRLSDDDAKRIFDRLETVAGLQMTLTALSTRSELLESFELAGDQLQVTFSRDRLEQEIRFLKDQGITQVVTLTEKHHSRDELSRHFDAHHFSIPDLEPPRFEQVQDLASLIERSTGAGGKLAVHCLAGIGRTSTMLISAHLILGETLEELKARISRQNPNFSFVGSQSDFIHSVAARLHQR